MGNVKESGSLKSKFWSVVVGASLMGAAWLYYSPSSDVIASAPDRIIPAASSNMAEGALNSDLLEVRVCDAYPQKLGQELLFVYDGKKQVGTVGQEGVVVTPYEGDSWQCR